MRRRQKFNELPVTCRKGTTAEGGQLGVGKAVKSGVDGSGRQVDTPTAGQLPSLVSYCLNRSLTPIRESLAGVLHTLLAGHCLHGLE